MQTTTVKTYAAQKWIHNLAKGQI